MRERPIMMSAPMVRAILDGRKSQTRRVVKPQPFEDAQGNACWNGVNFGQNGRGPLFRSLASPLPCSETGRVRCPYGAPGDRLWVREAWGYDAQGGVIYRADDNSALARQQQWVSEPRWRSPIHMPRWASRITLEVTGVRVERLQAISQADAIAEGAPPSHPSIDSVSREFGFEDFPRSWYAQVWESLHGPGSWGANPWVWIVGFRPYGHGSDASIHGLGIAAATGVTSGLQAREIDDVSRA